MQGGRAQIGSGNRLGKRKKKQDAPLGTGVAHMPATHPGQHTYLHQGAMQTNLLNAEVTHRHRLGRGHLALEPGQFIKA